MFLPLSVDEQKTKSCVFKRIKVQEWVKQKVKLRPRRSNGRRPRAGKEQGLENSPAGIQVPGAASCESLLGNPGGLREEESGFSAREPELDVIK